MIFVWVVELLIDMNTSNTKLYKITLALAGILQATTIVRDLAKTGTTDEAAFTTSINSIYKIDAANIIDIFGSTQNLRTGLKEIINLFGRNKTKIDPYISRYVVSTMHLERKLIKDKTIMDTLARRIKYAASQANYFSSGTHPTVIASLADIYINTIGTLPFRLQVLGQAKFLQQTETINKIRATLLAAVRSAVLWQQVGGNRLQLFFQRTKLANMAKQILNS